MRTDASLSELTKTGKRIDRTDAAFEQKTSTLLSGRNCRLHYAPVSVAAA
jgi:hypothetical protein